MKPTEQNNQYEIQEGYRIPLAAIRDAISTVLAKDKVKDAFVKHGCAIGFFRYKEKCEKGKDLMRMRIFHYEDDTLKHNFGDSEDFIKTLLEVISRKKGYSQFDHLNHFRKYYCTDDSEGMALYNLKINKEDVVKFCSDSQNVTFYDKKQENYKKISWETLLKDLKKPKSKYYRKYSKQLDHLIFSSEMKEVYIIPVPILSSPSVLVFFNAAAVKKELGYGNKEVYRLLRQILWKVSDAIFFHLYNRLIVEFTEESDSLIQLESIDTEQKLFEEFIKSISHILLPTKYVIDDDKEFPFFEWYGDKEECSLHDVQIEFTSKSKKWSKHDEIFNHKVKFELPNYKVPARSSTNDMCFEMRVSDKKAEGRHGLGDYWEQENKFRFTVQNLYKLIYSYWESIRLSKDFIANTLKPSLEKVEKIADLINLEEFTEAIKDLNDNINALSKGEISKPNSFRPIHESSGSSKVKFELVFMNESITHKGVNFERLYDVLTTQTQSLEDLRTYKDYIEGKGWQTPSNDEYKRAKTLLTTQFEDTKKLMNKLENSIKQKENLYYDGFESLIEDSNFRDLLFSFSAYYEILLDLKFKLKNSFHYEVNIPNTKYKKLISEIAKGEYREEYLNRKNEIKKTLNIKEAYLPASNSYPNDYRKSISKAINQMVEDSRNGSELKKVFTDANLVIQKSKGKLIFSADCIKNFQRDYFKEWDFGGNKFP